MNISFVGERTIKLPKLKLAEETNLLKRQMKAEEIKQEVKIEAPSSEPTTGMADDAGLENIIEEAKPAESSDIVKERGEPMQLKPAKRLVRNDNTEFPEVVDINFDFVVQHRIVYIPEVAIFVDYDISEKTGNYQLVKHIIKNNDDLEYEEKEAWFFKYYMPIELKFQSKIEMAMEAVKRSRVPVTLESVLFNCLNDNKRLCRTLGGLMELYYNKGTEYQKLKKQIEWISAYFTENYIIPYDDFVKRLLNDTKYTEEQIEQKIRYFSGHAIIIPDMFARTVQFNYI